MIVNKGDFGTSLRLCCAVWRAGEGGRGGLVCVWRGAGGDGDGGVEEEGQVSCFGGEPTIRKDSLETAGGGEVAGAEVWGLYNRGQNARRASL